MSKEDFLQYYDIDETAARRAKDMNSHYEYKPGSATAEYRAAVDSAAELAERQKAGVDPMYHERIDALLDKYARKLAGNMNHGFAIDARVPSILVAGPVIPARQKDKQNAARDSNMREYQEIKGLLDIIRSIGTGGISADDPHAVDKLKDKLGRMEAAHADMKAANAHYNKYGTMVGYAEMSFEDATRRDAEIAKDYSWNQQPFPKWQVSKRMHLYLDDESRARLEYLARVSNTSMSAVLRQIIQGASIKEMPPADYHAMTVELYRIGTNLNQIAKIANATGQPDKANYSQMAAELRAAILNIQRAVDMR